MQTYLSIVSIPMLIALSNKFHEGKNDCCCTVLIYVYCVVYLSRVFEPNVQVRYCGSVLSVCQRFALYLVKYLHNPCIQSLC